MFLNQAQVLSKSFPRFIASALLQTFYFGDQSILEISIVRVQILALSVAAIAACSPSVTASPADQSELITNAAQVNRTAMSTEASTLTTEEQTALKALGIAIAVPAEIPAGYRVSQVKLEPCPADSPRSPKGTCRFGPEYGIVYRNAARDSCFAIEATGGGLGGPVWEYSLPVSSSLLNNVAVIFGEVSAGESKTPSADQLDMPQPNLRTEWASTDSEGPFYSLAGADSVRSQYLNERPGAPASECQNTITPNEAIAIVQSLAWLE